MLILLASAPGLCLAVGPDSRPVSRFEVEGASRLYALAKLGHLTNTALLVEADNLSFLQSPVALSAKDTSVGAVVNQILGGREKYTVREQGHLIIISSPNFHDRILTLPLGPFSFAGGSLSSLHPFLAFTIRVATGCKANGYAWAGPSMDIGIPPMNLTHATAEQIIEKVADARESSMWIVQTDPKEQDGCADDPASHWQVGLYGFGSLFGGCETPFRESVGPAYVVVPQKLDPSNADCSIGKMN